MSSPSPPRVYAGFDACGSKNPARTDLKYYFLLAAWSCRAPLARRYVDVHREAPPFVPRRADVQVELARRLHASDLLLLILSARSAASVGWLGWEIDYAAGACGLPIVCAYAGRPSVDPDLGHPPWWPAALARLAAAAPRVPIRHVPFRPAALADAFSVGIAATAPRRAIQAG